MTHKHPIFPLRLDLELRRYVEDLAKYYHVSASAAVRIAIARTHEHMRLQVKYVKEKTK